MKKTLRQLCDEHGMSQEKMARALGMSVSGYQKKETGKRGMNLAFAQRVAKVLGCSAAEVLEAAGAAAGPTVEETEVLELWGRLTQPNREAIMRMLRLAAADPSATQGTSGSREAGLPPAPPRKPFGLHEDVSFPSKP
jgi:transcriptional regulator with XRE-family HTH domain